MSISPLRLQLPLAGQRPTLTARIKALAAEHGLAVSAVTSADAFPELGEYLQQHIASGRMAGLDWFTPERARFSTRPRNLQPSARSILSVGVAYWVGDDSKPEDGVRRGRISRYARGIDYHDLLKTRMKALHASIEEVLGHEVEARLLVDTARIVDRAVAARSGLGWYGKHSCLIVPGHGSWVMLGEMLLDVDLENDSPLAQNCGRCTICLDRCPTGAIVAPYTIDTSTCLSFQTIEQRGVIPRHLRAAMGDWVFGCDVCQDVCPYTKAARIADEPAFMPRAMDNAFPSLHWLLSMDENAFRARYRGTAVLRAKRRGLARNAAVALGNTGSDADEPVLIEAVQRHDEPLVRGHAAWALHHIGGTAGWQALNHAWHIEMDPVVREEISAALLSR